MAAPATRLRELFERLSVAAPQAVVAALVRYAHSQVAAAVLISSTPQAQSTAGSLEYLYDLLCEQIRLYHPGYCAVIKSWPGLRYVPRNSTGGECPSIIANAGALPQMVWRQFATDAVLGVSTQRFYRNVVLRYLRWLDAKRITLSNVTQDDMERFLAGKGLSETTKASYRAAIRRFHKAIIELRPNA
jgi:Phage integrase, N-terminal SAM-like domain